MNLLNLPIKIKNCFIRKWNGKHKWLFRLFFIVFAWELTGFVICLCTGFELAWPWEKLGDDWGDYDNPGVLTGIILLIMDLYFCAFLPALYILHFGYVILKGIGDLLCSL